MTRKPERPQLLQILTQEKPMKTYKIERVFEDQDEPGYGTKVLCFVFGECTKYPLGHVKLHSPTGFETGYLGSGPADLAASILADFLGVRPDLVEREWRHGLRLHADGESDVNARRVIAWHQSFKERFIAAQRIELGEHYEITVEQIREWMAKAGSP